MGVLEDAVAEKVDGSSLVDYAKENILFVEKAPHEWLFPRCVCTVHHGGSGTLAAALRAGRPTVITPVFLDQFDHAEMVKRLGAGVGTKHLSKLSVSQLASAIVRAC